MNEQVGSRCEKDILTSQGAILPQLSPMFVANRMIDKRAVMKAVTENALLAPIWKNSFVSDQDRDAVLKTLFCKEVKTFRVKQNRYDVCSSRKRATKDLLFISHVLYRILCRYHAVSTEDVAAKKLDVYGAKDEIFTFSECKEADDSS